MEDLEYEEYLEKQLQLTKKIEDVIAPFMGYHKREDWKVKGGLHSYW